MVFSFKNVIYSINKSNIFNKIQIMALISIFLHLKYLHGNLRFVSTARSQLFIHKAFEVMRRTF